MMLEGLVRGRSTTVLLLVTSLLAACGDARTSPDDGARTASATTTGLQSAESASEATPAPTRGTAWVVFGTEEGADTVFAEVARTPDERAQGLMYREELAENAGMLFVFQDLEERAFWMQNTFIPLDIAYMDPSFRIIDIKPMEPEDEAFVESSGPAQYALEVNRGWFEEHGITVGDTPRIFFGM